MNTFAVQAPRFDITNTLKTLLLVLASLACLLSIKAAYDLSRYFETFPRWFVPGFAVGMIVLIMLCWYFVRQAWQISGNRVLSIDHQSAYLWILMVLSFICTTSVHGFYPFHRNVLLELLTTDPVLRFNYAMAASGFLASLLLAGIYVFSPWKRPAVLGLLVLGLFLLIPNDNCANQFNFWWIQTVGASPLMYVPNLYMVFFVTCGLLGIHPKGVIFLAVGICFASLLLGLGHQFGILW